MPSFPPDGGAFRALVLDPAADCSGPWWPARTKRKDLRWTDRISRILRITRRRWGRGCNGITRAGSDAGAAAVVGVAAMVREAWAFGGDAGRGGGDGRGGRGRAWVETKSVGCRGAGAELRRSGIDFRGERACGELAGGSPARPERAAVRASGAIGRCGWRRAVGVPSTPAAPALQKRVSRKQGSRLPDPGDVAGGWWGNERLTRRAGGA